MILSDTKALKSLLGVSLKDSVVDWIEEKLKGILNEVSAKNLYMTYSLMGAKISPVKIIDFSVLDNPELSDYLKLKKVDALQLSRIYLLASVLEQDGTYFRSKVANLIQVADTGELETFLKFLVVLPQPENYKQAAVEALRTNIETVFDAISAENPYPGEYFNDQQWNQMYLKAAFMQQDLSLIWDIDKRANADLARIISDYAHERWAASRDVDAYFWRPVGGFLNDSLLTDMRRLLQSDRVSENRAGALCCSVSDNSEAGALLNEYPELKNDISNGKITWKNVAEW